MWKLKIIIEIFLLLWRSAKKKHEFLNTMAYEYRVVHRVQQFAPHSVHLDRGPRFWPWMTLTEVGDLAAGELGQPMQMLLAQPNRCLQLTNNDADDADACLKCIYPAGEWVSK